MKVDKASVSVVLPTLNEADNICPLITQIIENTNDRFILEVIVVDDDSSDRTVENIKHFQKTLLNPNVAIIIIENVKNLGLGGSILKGIKKATNESIVVMDSDFTHPPRYITELVRECELNSIVIGSRYVKGGFMKSRHLYISSKMYNKFLKVLLKLETRDLLGGFFAFNKSHLERYLTPDIFSGYGDYFVWLIYGIEKSSNLLYKEIPVRFDKRFRGQSKSRRFSMLITYFSSAVKCRKYFNKLEEL